MTQQKAKSSNTICFYFGLIPTIQSYYYAVRRSVETIILLSSHFKNDIKKTTLLSRNVQVLEIQLVMKSVDFKYPTGY